MGNNKPGPQKEDYCEHGHVAIFCKECFRPIMDHYMQHRLEQAKSNDRLMKSAMEEVIKDHNKLLKKLKD
jgi:alcohol dehydrogenase YqhD (iron-dependent ADH family)